VLINPATSPRQSPGKVHDAKGTIRYTVHGAWDRGLVLLPGNVTALPVPATVLSASDTVSPAPRVLWRATPQPDQNKRYYGMPVFAQQLNEPCDNVCTTDSRLRPDQRSLEDGNFEFATAEKLRLEAKQRAKRKEGVRPTNRAADPPLPPPPPPPHIHDPK